MAGPRACDQAAACTAIIPFAADGAAAHLQALADDRMRLERVVTFPPESAIGVVRLSQLPGKALGACAWAAGVQLACFVERHFAGRTSGLRVLELGCGTGVTAIALARLGMRVTATDLLPELVALAEENMAAASLRPGSCCVVQYAWGEPLPGQLLAPFDLVVGSEVNCCEGGFQPLVSTLCSLCQARDCPAPEILIAETLRNKQQPRFWAMVGEFFTAREAAAFPQRDGWNAHDIGAPVRILELQPRGQVRGPAALPAVAACRRVDCISSALEAVRESGACVLTGCGTSRQDAAGLASKLFGPRLRAAPQPAEVSNRVLSGRGILKEEQFRAHTDGHAYGDLFPDYFLLLCSQACSHGGANFLVDGYAVLDSLGASPTEAWVPSALELRAVDQTSRLPSISPVVLRTPEGRRALRCRLSGPPTTFAAQRAAADSDDPKQDAAMLEAYHAAVERAASEAPRVVLRRGEALIVDNYRMFHGRDSFADESRLLWRVWIWTAAARGVPSGELCSTPGDSAGTVTQDCGRPSALEPCCCSSGICKAIRCTVRGCDSR
eukprot:CAMPEP_0168400090 /NCGR_PEP_ID=MMETSP0228-20121227/22421_1 /TAXON_ID=133427 /ORGANISM="Protoceratium reticulatum, Strain CCCM 535 (=CCMP 1889)" /LENGTH=552 /DNA_ID=CAMNT_0008413625 /DNA_START=31 /DNA_END=1686 /DNA_ORIENTATION=+